MLDDCAGSLAMDEIAVGKCVLEHRHYRIAVVSRLRAHVLKDESECLKTASADVEFGGPILVQNGQNTREWSTSLSDDGNGHSAAHPTLSLAPVGLSGGLTVHLAGPDSWQCTQKSSQPPSECLSCGLSTGQGAQSKYTSILEREQIPHHNQLKAKIVISC
jgi:hypothetical protein